MDVVDALSSNTTAKTVVELTLNPHFRRHYSALNKAVRVSSISDEQLSRLAAKMMETPSKRAFHLFGTDVTSRPRPYADTLPDRGFVYQPNTLKGNKPIAIGHQYSLVALLPEGDKEKIGNWVIPLAMKRVGSQENKEMVGAQQVAAILNDEALPFGNDLCVEVADSAYSKPAYLNANRDKKNLISIVRARATRICYRQPAPQATRGSPKLGRPTWYGSPFNLKDPATWGAPDEVTETTFVSHKKIAYRVEIQAWSHLLTLAPSLRDKCRCARRKKLADAPTSFHAGENPLVQPNRRSLIPEAALVDCDGRQAHGIIFTRHLPSLSATL